MAPEQVRVSAATRGPDIYAMGVLLYELLTGVVPYPAEDALDAMRRKVQTDPPLVRPVATGDSARSRGSHLSCAASAARRALCDYDRVQARPAGPGRSRPADKYERDEPPPAPLGDLPPWRTSLPILAIVLGLSRR